MFYKNTEYEFLLIDLINSLEISVPQRHRTDVYERKERRLGKNKRGRKKGLDRETDRLTDSRHMDKHGGQIHIPCFQIQERKSSYVALLKTTSQPTVFFLFVAVRSCRTAQSTVCCSACRPCMTGREECLKRQWRDLNLQATLYVNLKLLLGSEQLVSVAEKPCCSFSRCSVWCFGTGWNVSINCLF